MDNARLCLPTSPLIATVDVRNLAPESSGVPCGVECHSDVHHACPLVAFSLRAIRLGHWPQVQGPVTNATHSAEKVRAEKHTILFYEYRFKSQQEEGQGWTLHTFFMNENSSTAPSAHNILCYNWIATRSADQT